MSHIFSVMVVDDDKLIVEDFQSLLNWKSLGCSMPEWASNGKEALRMMQDKHYDIVFTDISMPVMDGVELIRAAAEMQKNTIFIVISNFDDFDYVREALKLGAADYLLKYEIDVDSLTKSVKEAEQKLLERREKEVKTGTDVYPSSRLEIRRVIDYLQKHYMEEITLSEMSDLTGLSISYFCRLFKQETGSGFVNYLRDFRLSKAMYLLVSTTKYTSEIASEVGFTDYRYFCRIFREKTGMTCSEFRRANIDDQKQTEA